MSYANFEIIRPLYSLTKRISSATLKIGDRFIYPGHKTLLFKTDAKPIDGEYLCCDEAGNIKWIDGKEKVKKINGITFSLQSFSQQFKEEYLRQET